MNYTVYDASLTVEDVRKIEKAFYDFIKTLLEKSMALRFDVGDIPIYPGFCSCSISRNRIDFGCNYSMTVDDNCYYSISNGEVVCTGEDVDIDIMLKVLFNEGDLLYALKRGLEETKKLNDLLGGENAE